MAYSKVLASRIPGMGDARSKHVLGDFLPVAAQTRSDFMDAGLWASLASKRHFRLPHWGNPPSTGKMEAWLRRLGISVSRYCEWSGTKTLKSWIEMNPEWPLRAWVGLLLEAQENGDI